METLNLSNCLMQLYSLSKMEKCSQLKSLNLVLLELEKHIKQMGNIVVVVAMISPKYLSFAINAAASVKAILSWRPLLGSVQRQAVVILDLVIAYLFMYIYVVLSSCFDISLSDSDSTSCEFIKLFTNNIQSINNRRRILW